MALADVPFYGAYTARRQQNEARPLAELQQASGAIGLMAALQKQKQSEALRVALAESGGDAEKAVEAALKTGNYEAAHQLAPLAKMAQEARIARDTTEGLAALTGRAGGPVASPGQPQELGAGMPVSIAGEQPTAPAAPAGQAGVRQQRIEYLKGLSVMPKYANNPVVQQRIQAELDKLSSIKPMIEHNYPVAGTNGEPMVQPHISHDEGQTWAPVPGSVASPKFARQVAPVVHVNPTSGSALLAKDELEFMAGQYLAGDRTVMQNLGRGAQGAENIVKLRREITRQAMASGASPRDVAATIGEFEGFKSGQRALGTREAQIEMAANVVKQFAPLAVEASEKFDRTEFKTLNDIEKAVLSRTASPELRRFNFANTSLINAYARAISPSGVPTVSDKDHAREILDTGFSKGDYAAAVDQLGKEIEAELKAPGTVKRGMRKFLTGNEAAAPDAPARVPPAQRGGGAWTDDKEKRYQELLKRRQGGT